MADCFALIRSATQQHRAASVLALLDTVIFNALIGNHDAHGKNFSILYAANGAHLAPRYDLLCTAVYPTLTDKMAMKLGGKYRFNELYTQHWEQFAQEAGLSVGLTRKRVLQMAAQLPIFARSLLMQKGNEQFAASSTVQQIVAIIAQRCAQTIERLRPA